MGLDKKAVYYNLLKFFGNRLSSSDSLNYRYEFGEKQEYYANPVFNFYLLGQRWYDSEAGRFISRDFPINNANLYLYTFNNPLRFIDPLGLEREEECLERAWEEFLKCIQRASEFWDTMVKLCEQATKVCGLRLRCMQECLGLTPSKRFQYPEGTSPVDTYNKMIQKCREDYKKSKENWKKKRCET